MSKLISGIYGAFASRSRSFFLLGISLVIIGLLFSKAAISIGSFVLLGSWLLDGNLKGKINDFFRNKMAVAVGLLYFVHILGMIYTVDWDYGLKDLRIKIPLLLFPLIFATSTPLSEKENLFFHRLFVLSVMVSSFISTYLWLFGSETYVSDKRNLSLFTSHIRFGLMACLSVFTCLFYLPKTPGLIKKTGLLAIMLWLAMFLIIMESFTGLVALSCTLIAYLIISLNRRGNRKMMLLAVSAAVLTAVLSATYFYGIYKEFSRLKSPKSLPFEEFSAHGETYAHPALGNPNPSRQNGFLVYQNIAWNELISSWNERSEIPFDSNALNGYPVRHIILWYLTSKGMKKDSEAIHSLADYEIDAIERGVSNYYYLNRPGIDARILQTYWEINHYLAGGDFNGHSITMRWEFWNTTASVIRRHPLFGVGTGDIKSAIAEQYELNNSRLHPRWRLRSHNQYLTFTATFGLVGLLIILYSLLFPVFSKKHNLLYLSFILIIFISMINEDTVETQTGATLFAFFNAYYLFLHREKIAPEN